MRGMKKLPWIFLLSFITLFCRARVVPAQETPFLSQDEIRMFINEISGDRAYEHVRWLSHWARERGSDGYFEAADYLVKAAKEAGLEDVKFIEQPTRDSSRAYNARSAELWMVEPVEVKLADIGSHVLYLAIDSYDADVTAELVWIGDGSEEALEGLDVAGKIVLTSGQPGAAVRNAVWEKGAVGVVSYPMNNGKSRLGSSRSNCQSQHSPALGRSEGHICLCPLLASWGNAPSHSGDGWGTGFVPYGQENQGWAHRRQGKSRYRLQ